MPPNDTDTDLEADIRAAIDGPATEIIAEPEGQIPQPAEEGRARDEQGRFAPKTEPVDKQPEPPQSATAPAQEPAEPTILPPHSLKAAVKALFPTLPKDIQDEFLRIEGEAQRAKAEWSTKGETLNRFDALFAPVDDQLRLQGLDRFRFTEAMLAADRTLRTDFAAGIAQLAQIYGQQVPQGLQPQPGQQFDPAMQGLQQRLDRIEQANQAQQQAREAEAKTVVEQQIEAFRNDPKHLYFDNVRPHMVALLQAGAAEDLEDAYEQACYANREVRAAMAVKPVVPARPGKPNGIQPTGGPGQAKANGSSNPRSSHEDDVRAALEELDGRV